LDHYVLGESADRDRNHDIFERKIYGTLDGWKAELLGSTQSICAFAAKADVAAQSPSE
jgi:hypothetical protein